MKITQSLLFIVFTSLFLFSCKKDIPSLENNGIPMVKSDSTYSVIVSENIVYANGLSHDGANTSTSEFPLMLDVYEPDNNCSNRPVFMWIHGGGFTGGIKHNPEIVEIANYYASRGWVFISIDYRTTEELGNVQGMTEDQVFTYYKGIAPQEWIDTLINIAPTSGDFYKGIAMYTAQRDSKAALRWIVANSNTYKINTDYITVGGNSAGSVSTIALGISNQEDFRDEISISDDPTLSSTNLNETYNVKSMIYFWGSKAKLDVYEMVYGLDQHDRYDVNDPELFMGHGQAPDPQTPYTEALELQDIYNSLGIYSQLATLMEPDPLNPSVLIDAGHGAWDGVFDGKGLKELTFDFLTERQNLIVE